MNHGDGRTLEALNELDAAVEMRDYAALPDATWHHGHDGAIRWTRKLHSFGTSKLEPIEFLHAEDGRVVVPTRFSSVGKRSGLALAFEVAGVFTLRGGSE